MITLPATGRIRDFHPIERALTGRTKQKPLISTCAEMRGYGVRS